MQRSAAYKNLTAEVLHADKVLRLPLARYMTNVSLGREGSLIYESSTGIVHRSDGVRWAPISQGLEPGLDEVLVSSSTAERDIQFIDGTGLVLAKAGSLRAQGSNLQLSAAQLELTAAAARLELPHLVLASARPSLVSEVAELTGSASNSAGRISFSAAGSATVQFAKQAPAQPVVVVSADRPVSCFVSESGVRGFTVETDGECLVSWIAVVPE